jgi:hypothetical protein
MRFFSLDLLVGVSLVLGAAAGFACSSQGDDCEANKSCGTSGGGSGGTGAGGSGATGGAGGDGGGCDTSKSPSEEVCLVSDDHAIFVSPTGTDGASGTKTDPLKSLTEAATVAGASGKVVLVCAGTYDEHVMITGGAKLYGGFDCGTWAYDSAAKPNVSPTTTGYALEISAGSNAVVVEDIVFTSKAGDATNPSSIAAFARESSDVALRRVKLEAGAGSNGASGTLAPHTYPAQTSLNGNNATALPPAGGALKMCTCPGGGESIGGAGGNPTPPNGASGTDGGPSPGGGKGGSSGAPTDCGSGGLGKNGAAPGSPTNASGATLVGTLTQSGFIPGSGENGPNGAIGHGGGGGASTATGGGGGGGCGGCGGAGGPGGKGGGASVALLAFNSPVVVTESDLISSDAGDGGSGAAGQAGQLEVGFGGLQTPSGCSGGNGAAGGDGAAGGGGAGGVSAAIAYKGEKPTLTGGNAVSGEKGAPGVGGVPGSNDGVDGDEGVEVLLP